VRTAVNNRETLFEEWTAEALLLRVLRQARKLFTFEMRGFALNEVWLSFYIKPKDGFQLPAIMKWLKQTFAARFNARNGRSGHIWGDRYWSRVLEGEPPEGAAAVDWEEVKAAARMPEPPVRKWKSGGVRPFPAKNEAETGFSPEIPLRSASPPA
jgi:hypothetical protein